MNFQTDSQTSKSNAYIKSNSALQRIKPKKNEIGKVIIEARKILVITFLFSLLGVGSPPKTEALFTFPVLTGMPRSKQHKSVINAEISAKKPLDVSEFSLILSIEQRILLPQNSVEIDITMATSKTQAIGGAPLLFTLAPCKISRIARSFCPSCAPCINESDEQLTIRHAFLGFSHFGISLFMVYDKV